MKASVLTPSPAHGNLNRCCAVVYLSRVDPALSSLVQLMEAGRSFVSTYSPKSGEITRAWLVIDASDVVLGRLAVTAATLLRGKHKAQYAPHVDTGDFVVVVNASKIALTGNKRTDKMAYRHSGRPGGLKAVPYGELLDHDPRKAVELAVWGMLPKNKLARQLIKKLKVYAGPEHPHSAQKPQPYQITQIAQ